jgi:DNA polymerase-1
MRKKLYILDAANVLFRSFFAIRGMATKAGVPTNALYGFIRTIEKIIKDFQPEYMAVVLDGPSNKASRTKIYENYKSHREGMPEELVCQLAPAVEFCKLYGLSLFQIPGIEADDAIGSIAKFGTKAGFDVYMLSSDKDLCQLVGDHCFMINISKDNLLIDKEKVKEIHGVEPSQVVDLLAIMGDSSDNIPGIAGIGPKGAASLLSQFGSLDSLLSHVSEVKSASQREKIESNKENALISQKLATIDCSIDIPQDEKAYLIKQKDEEALMAFYTQMQFSSLVKAPPKNSPPQSRHHLIESEEDLDVLLTKFKNKKEICVDTEATSLEKMKAELVGVGLGISSTDSYYIPLNGSLPKALALKKLKKFFEDPAHSFFGHNIKYDLHVLSNHDIHVSSICFDTMLASYVLNPEKNRHGLDELALEIYGHQKVSFKELVGKEDDISKIAIDKVASYCCEDVAFTCLLFERFEPLILEKAQEFTFYEIEMPLLPILFAMERQGVFVDLHMLEVMSVSLKKDLDTLEKEIYALSGKSFNIQSPKQLGEILFEDLKIPHPKQKKTTGYSTAADVLEEIRGSHPIIEKILDFRTLVKLKSTYVDALPLQINNTTHKIHCTFNQTGTATGRLACQDPNLQNIPIRSAIGKTIRNAFKPSQKGYSFLSADYSQIELRIVAHLSNDKNMVHAFLHSSDIHRATAALIFNVPESEVTDQMRSQAKAVNFGIIYGQGPYVLSQQLGIDVRSAGKFIKEYYERYSGVKEFLDECKEVAKKEGVTYTMTKRRRAIPDIQSSNSFLRAAAERLAINSPIQGTQADIIKMAMIKIDQEVEKKGLDSRLILQIHDELIFECPDSELPQMQKLVRDAMENVTTLRVPLKVDMSIGKNWGEC